MRDAQFQLAALSFFRALPDYQPPGGVAKVSNSRPYRVVTDIEFCLKSARALLPGAQAQLAIVFVRRAVEATVDPRLRTRLSPIPEMIENQHIDEAKRWLTRAIDYEAGRRRAHLQTGLWPPP